MARTKASPAKKTRSAKPAPKPKERKSSVETRLSRYRKKRDFERTPEPSGGKKARKLPAGPQFVVQKHAATQLHYDFRLEHDGVLLSWSIPKGPSLKPGLRRLAVRTEDHPLDYADFEGVIPKGEYGGGTVIVWDRGTWTPEGDAQKALQKGHLNFELHGDKLRGRFHLVRTKLDAGKRENWLLFKSHDAGASDTIDIVAERPQSAISGRTLEEVRELPRRVWHSNKAKAANQPPPRSAGAAKQPPPRSAGAAKQPPPRGAGAAKQPPPRSAGAAKQPPPRSAGAAKQPPPRSAGRGLDQPPEKPAERTQLKAAKKRGAGDTSTSTARGAAKNGAEGSADTVELVKRLPLPFGLSNLDKVLYPEANLRKAELIAYYVTVASYMLPHVKDRPLTLVRCPNGVQGKCFFQKHLKEGVPDAVEPVPIEESGKSELYMAITDLPGLIALAQQGVLEIHTWGCHRDQLEKPDKLVFDVDPDAGLAWDRVIEAAMELRERLMDVGLQSFVQTTGGKGLHVVAPIARRMTWDEHKNFSLEIAESMASEHPKRYLTKMSKALRKGKIFLDYLRNGRGATAIAPYSTRARQGATVATPITWDELAAGAKPEEFTIRSLAHRLSDLNEDPWLEYQQFSQQTL